MHKTRINLANQFELLEIPGVDRMHADAILAHRAHHGPILDADTLGKVVGPASATSLLDHVDFTPGEQTAPEAPGA
jgi:DNA uptake protein ComE-like DNA-binding protein